MTMLKRLLSYPHAAVFDTDPDEGYAFQVRRNVDCAWIIEDGTLKATTASQTYSYDLSSYTIGTLAAKLATDGFEVGGISAEFAGLSAMVLVDGTHSTTSSHSAALKAFRSIMWSIYSGYARELKIVEQQVKEAIKQMVIPTSSGEWLDLWANLYNQKRASPTQTDEQLAAEIPKEAFRIRINAVAIEKAVYDKTGKHIFIEEPFNFMFRLDESRLSSNHKFYNGFLIGPHLIRPVSFRPIKWDDVLPVVNRNKAAGIIVLPPEVRPSFFVDATLDGSVSMSASTIYSSLTHLDHTVVLDEMRLDDDRPTLNWRAAVSNIRSTGNMRYSTWRNGYWDETTWAESNTEVQCPVYVTMNTYGSTADDLNDNV